MHYLLPMDKIDIKAVLWENIRARMTCLYGKENLSRLIQDAHIGPGTATRIKEQQTSVGVDVLEKLSEALKTQPWQLLRPNVDENKPLALIHQAPVATNYVVLSADALRLAKWLDEVPDAALKARAYAECMGVINKRLDEADRIAARDESGAADTPAEESLDRQDVGQPEMQTGTDRRGR